MSPYLERIERVIEISKSLRGYPDDIIHALSQSVSASDDEREAIRLEQLRRRLFSKPMNRSAA